MLSGCAVLIGNIEVVETGPTDLTFPSVQAWYGRFRTGQQDPVPVTTFSLPNAWKAPSISLAGDNVKALEEVILPCTREFPDNFSISNAPAFGRLDLPKAEVINTNIDIIDSTETAPALFDIDLPKAYVVFGVQIERSPSVQNILMPVANAIDVDMILIDNANVETVIQPRMKDYFSSSFTLKSNPKLRLVDRSSQPFVLLDPPPSNSVEIENNAPEGLELRLCSLNAFQTNQLKSTPPPNTCSAQATPPCFLLDANSEACTTKRKEGKGISEEKEAGFFGLETMNFKGLLGSKEEGSN
uniref:Uncharacterized protein n=1 Tax=Chromera velia CCMP2878 TaxID=1169474 RepID=A0A0G4HBI6_9ALVE|eukprot:Cvel_6203.t1-p1 / transcript=Cvel_6203.t1 / gene=Cvel_6203 / organism=Chromera_velia_CCMP2878 / gene_product=hypothetical protein / transcript_product=hypothetical protein / location=Cvel_scaffold300:58626-60518(+) / protein_length=298 / sequence_SO=supercontig / SO=protein_coding / is_pseudo=false